MRLNKTLDLTSELVSKKIKTAHDLRVMLSIYSSYCCVISRKLISAETDLKRAITIYRRAHQINPEHRPDIPVIPKQILKHRLMFQSALISKAYGKVPKTMSILMKLIKDTKIYDPETRLEALNLIKELMVSNQDKQLDLQKTYPELENIDAMLELFDKNKNKNCVLLVDASEVSMVRQSLLINIDIELF